MEMIEKHKTAIGSAVLVLLVFFGFQLFFNTDEYSNYDMVYDAPGVYDENIFYEDVIIISDGVELKNLTSNNITVAEDIADGTITLTNVTVDGTLSILGGGENSVYVNSSLVNNVYINYDNVRVVMDASTEIENIETKEIKKLEIAGIVNSILMTSGKVELELSTTAAIDELLVNGSVTKLDITGSGTIKRILSVKNEVVTYGDDIIVGEFKYVDSKFNDVSYDITFYKEDGSVHEVKTVSKYDQVTAPYNPTNYGYTFAGWTLNDEIFDFSTLITKDIDLYPTWTELDLDYSIVYPETDYSGGNTEDNAGDKDESLEDGTEEDLKEEEIFYTVTFVSDFGLISVYEVKENSTVDRIEIPEMAGYLVDGWYVDGQLFDFDSIITSDITIKAQYFAAPVFLNDVYYRTMKEALEANVENYEIVIKDHIVENIVIPEGKNVSIDLNGFSITNAENGSTIENNGILNIIDSSKDQTGEVINKEYFTEENVELLIPAVVRNNGAITIQGGSYSGNIILYIDTLSSKNEIYAGTYTSNNFIVSSNEDIAFTVDIVNQVKVIGNVVLSDNIELYIEEDSTLTIVGTFEGNYEVNGNGQIKVEVVEDEEDLDLEDNSEEEDLEDNSNEEDLDLENNSDEEENELENDQSQPDSNDENLDSNDETVGSEDSVVPETDELEKTESEEETDNTEKTETEVDEEVDADKAVSTDESSEEEVNDSAELEKEDELVIPEADELEKTEDLVIPETEETVNNEVQEELASDNTDESVSNNESETISNENVEIETVSETEISNTTEIETE
ncbi:MAG: InlB B-repeat-containing protein [bacterium]